MFPLLKIIFKKFFYDLWDNLLSSVFLNFIFLIFVSFSLFLLKTYNLFLSISIIFLLFSCWISLTIYNVNQWTSYLNSEFKINLIYKNLRISLIYIFILLFVLVNFFISIPFYINLNSLYGLFIVSVLFWTNVFIFLALMFFLPLSISMPKDNILKSLKKSLIILMDNILISFCLLLILILISFISIFSVFIFVGPSGLLLFYSISIKIILLKYDYLEKYPNNKKNIPWSELILNENQTLGYRSLKDFLFPWK